ncbi:MAG: ester cyclase [Anaerolineae bacterium]|nr:ester cyclase [Anaerolineae bacterium]
MSLEANKRLVRRYFEDAPFNPTACDEIFAPRFQFHTIMHANVTAQVVESSPEGEKAAYEQHKATFGGWHFEIEEMIAEDDRVMVRWTSHGTHIGELNGLPPTGRQTTNSGINIFRVADGKIVEVWDIFDRLWAWQQLGVLPDLNEAIATTREAMLSARADKSK